ncbi:hypothetical protein ZWY2020_047949 [Hordeum vulgare]|nr:hypothetical protein ZWY2020_047949 [Hordeum vulgare]
MLVHPLLKDSSSTAAPKVYCSCTGCSEWIYEGHHLLANILWSATSQARRKLLDSLPRMLLSPLSDGAVRQLVSGTSGSWMWDGVAMTRRSPATTSRPTVATTRTVLEKEGYPFAH